MKKKKNKARIDPAVAFGLLFLVLLLGCGDSIDTRTARILLILLFLAGLIALIKAIVYLRKKPSASAKANTHEPRVSAKPERGDDNKDAIRCTCSQGRQRYLDQAELFLKNGIIDKAEYNVMKERYLKMELPDGL